MSQVKPIPEGFHTLTPHIVVKDAAKAIEFYKEAFGAEEICRMPGPGGQGVMHAEIKIGDSMVMMCDEFPQTPHFKSPESLNGTTNKLTLYVTDCDKVFNQAVASGATAEMPPTDMFWGDRYGTLVDPFGHEWAVATHKEDLTPEDIGKRAAEFFSSQSGCSG